MPFFFGYDWLFDLKSGRFGLLYSFGSLCHPFGNQFFESGIVTIRWYHWIHKAEGPSGGVSQLDRKPWTLQETAKKKGGGREAEKGTWRIPTHGRTMDAWVCLKLGKQPKPHGSETHFHHHVMALNITYHMGCKVTMTELDSFTDTNQTASARKVYARIRILESERSGSSQ